MKILAFGASSSRQSINKKLVTYAMNLLNENGIKAEVEILDLNDYPLPLFSVDLEEAGSHPQNAKDFLGKITEADAVVISFAEHNGSYTAAYKNLYDWLSRITQKVFADKKMVLLATSPGPGGAKTVLGSAQTSIPFFAGEVLSTFSLPSFYDNFDTEANTIKDNEFKISLIEAISKLQRFRTS